MRRLGSVAIVCVGLGMIGLGISLLQQFLSFMLPGDAAAAALLGLFPSVIAVVVGLYLIVNRDRYSAAWFDEGDTHIAVDSRSLVPVAVAMLGLWLLASSVAYLANAVVFVIQNLAYEGYLGADYVAGAGWVHLTNIVPPLVSAAVGLLMIKRAALVSGWILHQIPTPERVQVSPSCPECGAPYDPRDYATGATPLCGQCGGELRL